MIGPTVLPGSLRPVSGDKGGSGGPKQDICCAPDEARGWLLEQVVEVGGERWSDFRYTWMVEPIGFADGLDRRCWEKNYQD